MQICVYDKIYLCLKYFKGKRMKYNKLNLINATLALLLLNACGSSKSNDSQANSCETSYEILVKQIDKNADGTIDEILNYEYNEDALLTRIYDANSSEDVRVLSYNNKDQNIHIVDYSYILLEQEFEYKYDTFDRISSIHIITTYQDDENNWITATTGDPVLVSEDVGYFYNNDYIVENTYENNRIDTSTLSREGVIFEIFHYTYDKQGNMITDRRLNSDGETLCTTKYTNTYDNNSNLIRVDVDINEDRVSDHIYEYSYDEFGNIIEESHEYRSYYGDMSKQILTYEWGCI